MTPKLTLRQARAVLACVQFGLTHDSAGRIFGVTQQAISGRLKRARELRPDLFPLVRPSRALKRVRAQQLSAIENY